MIGSLEAQLREKSGAFIKTNSLVLGMYHCREFAEAAERYLVDFGIFEKEEMGQISLKGMLTPPLPYLSEFRFNHLIPSPGYMGESAMRTVVEQVTGSSSPENIDGIQKGEIILDYRRVMLLIRDMIVNKNREILGNIAPDDLRSAPILPETTQFRIPIYLN